MKTVVIGGHSRNIGKTSVAVGLIAATRELSWTALKITQFGHGICSTSGKACHCAVDDPEHPFAVSRETDAAGDSDTARMLRAGAAEVFWVRAPQGRLAEAMPEIRKLLKGREHVLFESNSVLRFVEPDIYLPVLRFDVADFKASSRKYLERADAFVVVECEERVPGWRGVEAEVIDAAPNFWVRPPEYFTAELERFLRLGLGC
jgi:hypothetical protein